MMQAIAAMIKLSGKRCKRCEKRYVFSVEEMSWLDGLGNSIASWYGRRQCDCGVQTYTLGDDKHLWIFPEKCPCCKEVMWSQYDRTYYESENFMGFCASVYCKDCGTWTYRYSDEADYIAAYRYVWSRDRRFDTDEIPF